MRGLALAVLLVGLGVAACGGDDGGGSTPAGCVDDSECGQCRYTGCSDHIGQICCVKKCSTTRCCGEDCSVVATSSDTCDTSACRG